MDAKAHLISLGWAGPGHALDSRPSSPGTYKQKGHRGLAYDPKNDPLKVGNTGTGLVKPLLVSQRKNRFGVGKRAHEAPAGNEWWLKGFESALGNIGKSESERSSGATTPVHINENGVGGKHSGLYSFFIRGQMMQGTIGEETLDASRTSRKRKSDEFEESDGTSTIQLNPRPTSPKKPASARDFEVVGAFIKARDAEEKRGREREKAGETEQFAQIGEFFGAVEKPRRQKRKSDVLLASGDRFGAATSGVEEREETKEERRERRRKKKEAKALKAATNGEEKKDRASSGSEDSAMKAARKVEKRRRKAEKTMRKNVLV